MIKRSDEIIQSALEFIEINLREKIGAHDIAKAAGTDEAYLRKLFRKRFKMSCVPYLKMLRLKAIRKRIQRNPLVKIGDLSEEYLWKNHGDMTHMYKEQFGELPSETARRALTKR